MKVFVKLQHNISMKGIFQFYINGKQRKLFFLHYWQSLQIFVKSYHYMYKVNRSHLLCMVLYVTCLLSLIHCIWTKISLKFFHSGIKSSLKQVTRIAFSFQNRLPVMCFHIIMTDLRQSIREITFIGWFASEWLILIQISFSMTF